MPELPEVETIRSQLREVLVGKKLVEVEVLNQKSFIGERDEVLGQKVTDVLRRAKVIEIALKKKPSVFVHLKMTGQLIHVDGKTRVVGGHPTADWVNDLPSKHTRVIWKFDDGSKLFFNDLRKFGWMKILRSSELHIFGSGTRIVPDVIDEEFTVKYLERVLKKSRRVVKLAILDQSLMGGMGNIYANDALYLAKVRPDKVSSQLSDIEIGRLHKAMINVIEKGIKYGGASAANYVDTKGMGGTYQDHFLVYKQDGKLCKICKSKIMKMKLGGRGTFYCPGCQK